MTKKILLFSGLLTLALVERLWFDLGPNVELVMVAAVLAAVYLGKEWGLAVAVIALAISDMFLGNTRIMLFTWSAFGLIGWLGSKVGRWQGRERVLAGAGFGLIGALFFYVYTNFGVWLIGGLYPRTWQGLVECYRMGLPFLKLHAVSSMLLVPLGLGLVELARRSAEIGFLRIVNTKR